MMSENRNDLDDTKRVVFMSQKKDETDPNYLCTLHISEDEWTICSNQNALISKLRDLSDSNQLLRIGYRVSKEHRDGTRRILLNMASHNSLPKE